MTMTDETIRFGENEQNEIAVMAMLSKVYAALEEKGYNPIDQIIGYLLTEDPAYIPRHNNARQLIRQVDRDIIMEVVLRDYLKHNGIEN